MIRLIATDLDGTLFAAKSELPQENIDALKRAMARGTRVMLCTGRMLESTMPVCDAIGVNAPIVIFNGGMVVDPATKEILYRKTIPNDVAVQVLREIERRGTYVQAFPGKGYFYRKHTAWSDTYANKIGVRGEATDIPLSQWLRSDACKLLALGECGELDSLMKDLKPLFPQLTFAKSSATFLEIMAAGVDKGSGMQAACELLGIAPDEVIAFGDEENDLPLLSYAGTGYVMGNANEAILARYPLVAPKNTECGVARIVNQYLDEGRMGGELKK